MTAAVDNGLLSSLRTVSLKRSGCNQRNTPFVEKEEAREVGLCRGDHLGLKMLWKPKYNLLTGRNRKAAIVGEEIENLLDSS